MVSPIKTTCFAPTGEGISCPETGQSAAPAENTAAARITAAKKNFFIPDPCVVPFFGTGPGSGEVLRKSRDDTRDDTNVFGNAPPSGENTRGIIRPPSHCTADRGGVSIGGKEYRRQK